MQQWVVRTCFQIMLVAIALSGLVAGCVAPGGENRALKVLMANKEASLADWNDVEIDGQPAVHMFRAKTAMLLDSAEVSIDSHADSQGTLVAKFDFALERDAGVGSAVPVTRDGYFLTAAHCLEASRRSSKPSVLVAVVDPENGKFGQAPFRVVWRSPDKRELDLAVIHAPLRPWQAFTIAPFASYKQSMPVAAVGWSGLFEGVALPASAGKLHGVSPQYGERPGVVWRYVAHDAPLNQGDSGGPLVDRRGRLVGVNFVLVTRTKPLIDLMPRSDQRLMAEYRGFAIAPDANWLREVIAADRARRS